MEFQFTSQPEEFYLINDIRKLGILTRSLLTDVYCAKLAD